MSAPGDTQLVVMPSGKQHVMVRGTYLWGFQYPSAEDLAYVSANPRPVGAWTAPTLPVAQRLVTLGQGVSTAEVTASTQTYSVRIVNESTETWDTVALEYLAAGDADILAVWVGVQADADTGDQREPDSGTAGFMECKFGGVSGKTIVAGSMSSPSVVWTDVTSLVSTCPPGGALVIRWVLGGGSVSFSRAGNAQNWPSGLVRDSFYGAGDAGSVIGNLDNVVSWSSGYAPPLHGLRVGFSGPTPEVQVLMFGDSVVEQERPLADPNGNNSREGVLYLTDGEAENMHVASAGQGGFTMDEARDRLDAQLASLVGAVDIIGFQTHSHNQRPADLTDLSSFMARIAAIKADVEAAGLAFFPFTLTGPADDYTADEITAWNQLRVDMAAAYPDTYVDIAASVMTGSVNNTTYLPDKAHIGSVGAPIAKASFWPQMIATATALGYGPAL